MRWFTKLFGKWKLSAARTRRVGLGVEKLEDRLVPTITVQFDYSYDVHNFFSDPARKDILNKAANDLVSRLGDHLTAITPVGGDNTWTAAFTDPSTGGAAAIPKLTVPADTLIVYVGGRSFGSDTATIGRATSSYSSFGTDDWNNAVRGRGQAGALLPAGTQSDVGPWGGSIGFDNTHVDWYFGLSSTGMTSTQEDFYSVAQHELGHLLGIGTSTLPTSWNNQIANGVFNGPEAEHLYGGPVPVDPSQGHWADGVQYNGRQATMDPHTPPGHRFAALRHTC